MKSRNIKLSFAGDEEEEEEESFSFSNNKLNNNSNNKNPRKRMMQAPGLAPASDIETLSSIHQTSNSYNKESLESLKKAQNFAKPPQEIIPEEPIIEHIAQPVIELSGDAAEAFEKILESNESKSSNAMIDDFFSQHEAKFRELESKKKAKVKGRVYTSDLLTKEKTEKFAKTDFSMDNDENWEDEIIRRGVIDTKSYQGIKETIQEKEIKQFQKTLYSSESKTNHQLPANYTNLKETKPSKPSSSHGLTHSEYFPEVDILDIINHLQTNIMQLEENQKQSLRQIEQLQNEKILRQQKCQSIQHQIEHHFEVYRSMEDYYTYFPNVVGMLRAKQPPIEQLRTTLLTNLQNLSKSTIKNKLSEQEYWLILTKSKSELISIGSYKPSSSFFLATPASIPQEFKLHIQSLIQISSSIDYQNILSIFSPLFTSPSYHNQCVSLVQSYSEIRQSLFQDVDPDIASFASIIQHFTKLRTQLGEQYYSAFIPLSITKSLDILILVSLFDSIVSYLQPPIDSPILQLTDNWYSSLLGYLPPPEMNPLHYEDEINLLIHFIKQPFLPWIEHLIINGWNIMDTQSSYNLCSLLDHVINVLFPATQASTNPLIVNEVNKSITPHVFYQKFYDCLFSVVQSTLQSYLLPICKIISPTPLHPVDSMNLEQQPPQPPIDLDFIGIGKVFMLRQLAQLQKIISNILIVQKYLLYPQQSKNLYQIVWKLLLEELKPFALKIFRSDDKQIKKFLVYFYFYGFTVLENIFVSQGFQVETTSMNQNLFHSNMTLLLFSYVNEEFSWVQWYSNYRSWEEFISLILITDEKLTDHIVTISSLLEKF